MRSLIAGERAVLSGARYGIYARLEVLNASGTWKELTALSGVDWLDSLELSTEVDQPTWTATFALKRSAGVLSLSPLMAGSSLNVNNSGQYAPLLNAGSRVRFSTAFTPSGAPAGGDWRIIFEGQVDILAWEKDPISIQCRDLGSILIDTWIETEREYGSPTGVAMETVIQNILDDNLDSSVFLNVPSSPSTMLTTKMIPATTNVMEAVRGIALGIGWDIRYKWSGSAFLLTLYQPNRTTGVAQTSFGPSEYFDVPGVSMDKSGVRNVVVLNITLATTGARVPIVVQDPASILIFGRLPIVIDEAATSQIDTQSEGDALAAAILSDLSSPKVSHTIETSYFWPAELGDVYDLAANAVHYDQAQRMGVVGITHQLAGAGKGRTLLRMRAKPIGAYAAWLTRSNPNELGILPGVPEILYEPTIQPLTVGGVIVGWRLGAGRVDLDTSALIVTLTDSLLLQASSPTAVTAVNGPDTEHWLQMPPGGFFTLDVTLVQGGSGVVTLVPASVYNPTAALPRGGVLGPSMVLALDRAPVTTIDIQEPSITTRLVTLSVRPVSATIKYRFGPSPLAGSEPWVAAPPGGSVQLFIDISAGPVRLEFFSVSVDGVTEEIQAILLDQATLPFVELSFAELTPNQLTINLFMSDDVVKWELFVRRGQFPLDGPNVIDRTRLKEIGNRQKSQITFKAEGNGVAGDDDWFALGTGYDKWGDVAPFFSGGFINIKGASGVPVVGALSDVLATLSTEGANHFIDLTWKNNVVVEAASPSRFGVRITENAVEVQSQQAVVDHLGTDTIASHGGWHRPVSPAAPYAPGASYLSFIYTVQLYDAGVWVASYGAFYNDWFYTAGFGVPPATYYGEFGGALVAESIGGLQIAGSWDPFFLDPTYELAIEWHSSTDAFASNDTLLFSTVLPPGTVSAIGDGYNPGRYARFRFAYLNLAGAGPWSVWSNIVVASWSSGTAPAMNVSPVNMPFTWLIGAGAPAAQTATITSVGTAPLPVPTRAIVYGSATTGWISSAVVSGAYPGPYSVAVTLNPSAITVAGAYPADIILSAAGAPDVTLNVDLQVLAAQANGILRLGSSAGAALALAAGGSSTVPTTSSVEIYNDGPPGSSLGTLSVTGETSTNWASESIVLTPGGPGVATFTSTPGGGGTGGALAALTPGTSVVKRYTISGTGSGVLPVTYDVTVNVAVTPVPPQIVITPNAVTWNATTGDGQSYQQTFTITNGGGGTLPTVVVTETAPWLTYTQGGSGNSQTVTFTGTTGALTAAQYTHAPSIAAAGASNTPQAVSIIFNVSQAVPAAQLVVTPTTVSWTGVAGAAQTYQQVFAITNSGGGTLPTVVVTESAAWLTYTQAGSGNSQTVTVTATAAALTQGAYSTPINIAAAGAQNTPVVATANFTVNPQPAGIQVSPGSVTWNATQGNGVVYTAVLTITNTNGGVGAVLGTIAVSESASWLTYTQAGSGNNQTVTLTGTPGAMTQGSYPTNVSLAAVGANNTPVTVPVTLNIGPPFVPGAYPSPPWVTDPVLGWAAPAGWTWQPSLGYPTGSWANTFASNRAMDNGAMPSFPGTVRDCPTGATLNAALAACASGDIIEVYAGVQYNDVQIPARPAFTLGVTASGGGNVWIRTKSYAALQAARPYSYANGPSSYDAAHRVDMSHLSLMASFRVSQNNRSAVMFQEASSGWWFTGIDFFADTPARTQQVVDLNRHNGTTVQPCGLEAQMPTQIVFDRCIFRSTHTHILTVQLNARYVAFRHCFLQFAFDPSAVSIEWKCFGVVHSTGHIEILGNEYSGWSIGILVGGSVPSFNSHFTTPDDGVNMWNKVWNDPAAGATPAIDECKNFFEHKVGKRWLHAFNSCRYAYWRADQHYCFLAKAVDSGMGKTCPNPNPPPSTVPCPVPTQETYISDIYYWCNLVNDAAKGLFSSLDISANTTTGPGLAVGTDRVCCAYNLHIYDPTRSRPGAPPGGDGVVTDFSRQRPMMISKSSGDGENHLWYFNNTQGGKQCLINIELGLGAGWSDLRLRNNVGHDVPAFGPIHSGGAPGFPAVANTASLNERIGVNPGKWDCTRNYVMPGGVNFDAILRASPWFNAQLLAGGKTANFTDPAALDYRPVLGSPANKNTAGGGGTDGEDAGYNHAYLWAMIGGI